MIGRDSRDDIDGYGFWPWVGGAVFFGVLIFVMFQFANPIS